MAKRKSNSAQAVDEAASGATITRISASDTDQPRKSLVRRSVKTKDKATATKSAAMDAETRQRHFGVIGSFFGYFKNAWIELRQVHWPTRGATWSLTFAVLAFSAFFVVFILLLDAGFKLLFEQLLR